jgi:hypothetical protein
VVIALIESHKVSATAKVSAAYVAPLNRQHSQKLDLDQRQAFF